MTFESEDAPFDSNSSEGGPAKGYRPTQATGMPVLLSTGVGSTCPNRDIVGSGIGFIDLSIEWELPTTTSVYPLDEEKAMLPNQGCSLDEARISMRSAESFKRPQSDSEAVFEQVILRYQNVVYNLAYRLLGNSEDARDVAQETFFLALRRLGDFRAEASFCTWLSRITVNVCRSRQRHQNVRSRVMSSVDVTTESILDARAEQPFAFADEKERAIAVRFAVSTLDSKYREVVVLRDMEGFSYDEVAGILGVPVGTVRSRLYRARNILRDELGPQLED